MGNRKPLASRWKYRLSAGEDAPCKVQHYHHRHHHHGPGCRPASCSRKVTRNGWLRAPCATAGEFIRKRHLPRLILPKFRFLYVRLEIFQRSFVFTYEIEREREREREVEDIGRRKKCQGVKLNCLKIVFVS